MAYAELENSGIVIAAVALVYAIALRRDHDDARRVVVVRHGADA